MKESDGTTSAPGAHAALETALRVADLRFAGVVEIAADAIISVDAEQRIVYFNDGAAEIFGYTRDEVLNEPLALLLPERFRAGHAAHVAGFGAGAEVARRMGHRRAISALRRNGEEFPAEASISKFTGPDGAVVYNVVLRDVTERQRTESAQRFLAEAGDLLGSSLDREVTLRHAAQLAVPLLGDLCTVDVFDGGRLLTSAAAHVDDPELAPRAARRRLRAPDVGGDHPAAIALRNGSVEQRESVDEATIFCEDGVYEPAGEGAWTALFLPLVARGESLGVLGVCRRGGPARRYDRDDEALAGDYARRIAMALDNARLYEEAQRAVRVRDDTVAVVSHDLRNPVNAIRMLVRNLVDAKSPPGAAELADSLEVISEAASQADALIADLLDITRLEAGRFPLRLATASPRTLVQPALDVLAPLAEARGVALVLTITDDAPDASVDAARIHQVVSNLVANAIKFTPGGGHVGVRLAAAGAADALEIRVTDTGRGIAPDQLPHVFDRFWQASRTNRDGAGLGLPIAKGIVDAHGGTLRVWSAPGEGSTFVVTLPIEPVGGRAAS